MGNKPKLRKGVLKTIRDRGLISRNDRVLVAVSGGPDSVALLHLLKSLGFSLTAAHLNHMIRGSDADADEKYVAGLCGKLNVPLRTASVNVPAVAKELKLSMEDAARRVRYKFLEGAAVHAGAAKIAVGHTADDNVETVLMRLVTGTGARGLLGIPPRRGRIVRPLIDSWRSDVEAYCRKNRLRPRTDKSNSDTKYLRNRIRRKLIPALNSINPNARRSILRTVEMLGADYDYLKTISTKALHGATIRSVEGSIRLDIDKLLMFPDSVRRYVLRSAIESVKGDLENVTFTHVDGMISKLPDDKKWELHLPSGVFASGNGDELEITSSRPIEERARAFTYKLKIPGKVNIKEAGLGIKAEAAAVPKRLKLKRRNVAVLDIAKTGKVLTVRSRRPGDRFSPFGIGGSKKLKDFMTDEKIPSSKKNLVPIVEAKKKIIWVAGHRIDDAFKVTGATRRVLKLTLYQV